MWPWAVFILIVNLICITSGIPALHKHHYCYYYVENSGCNMIFMEEQVVAGISQSRSLSHFQIDRDKNDSSIEPRASLH